MDELRKTLRRLKNEGKSIFEQEDETEEEPHKGVDDPGGGTKPTATKEQIVAWFRKHPNPEDEEAVHAWADEKGWNVHELEELIYSVLTDYIEGKR